ncbi:MAG: class I SAM-dependent methyltransferase [Ruminococcus sp.]|nr:class I SAM-dependent methyltransferase [Ruminococcus sp.]
MEKASNWRDYELVDCSSGEKLERFGKYKFIRPDPQIIWKTAKNADWDSADAHYIRSEKGGGRWEYKTAAAKERQVIRYDSPGGELRFIVKPTDFKHMGIFPEQAANWDRVQKLIAEARGQRTEDRNSDGNINAPNILNLFAYTGGATIAAAKAGARVCHVDAAKGMVSWARENALESGLNDAPIRWITDDCAKFVQREIRRGVRYDGIIMDPPSYGRGPGGELWKLEDNLFEMAELAAKLLSDKPLFFMLNSYTTGLSAEVMEYLLRSILPEMNVTSFVLGLPVKGSENALPCGSTALATNHES